MLADRITVLRDGRYVGDLARAEATHDKIVAMMVGRELSSHYFPEKTAAPRRRAPRAGARGARPARPRRAGRRQLHRPRGEILGFAGLVGAGRTELMQTIFGVTPALRRVDAARRAAVPAAQRPRRHRRGVYLAPEDRKRHGLVLPMTVAENTSLPGHRQLQPLGLARPRAPSSASPRPRSPACAPRRRASAQKVVNLSGGNQQKVVLGKWLAMNPRVLILDEPTRGIDVGAKAEIYRHMAALAAQGITILMVSSDMEEVLGMSDRVVVMHERRIRGVLARARRRTADDGSRARSRRIRWHRPGPIIVTSSSARRRPDAAGRHETRAGHVRRPGDDLPGRCSSPTPTSSAQSNASTPAGRSRCSGSTRSASGS